MGALDVIVAVAIIAAFSGLPTLTPQPQLEIIPDVPKVTPVKIYVERLGVCEANENRILEHLPIVFELHRQAIIRFIGEMGREYDKLLELQFELTSYKEDAVVIFRVDRLEWPIAGLAALGSSLPLSVAIDCDVASLNSYGIVLIVMHELYHTLGLGHPSTAVYGEPMGEPYGGAYLSDYVYPTTLDMMALYERYFGQNRADSVYFYKLPENIPYVPLIPYASQLESLNSQTRALRNRLYNVTAENNQLRLTLTNDIKKLESELSALNMSVRSLGSDVGSLRRSVDRIESRLSSVEANITGLDSRYSELKRRSEEVAVGVNIVGQLLFQTRDNLTVVRGEVEALRSHVMFLERLVWVFGGLGAVLFVIVLAVLIVRRGGKHG